MDGWMDEVSWFVCKSRCTCCYLCYVTFCCSLCILTHTKREKKKGEMKNIPRQVVKLAVEVDEAVGVRAGEASQHEKLIQSLGKP